MASNQSTLRIGYDGFSFGTSNQGSGKGLQLRNLLAGSSGQMIGFAPPGQTVSAVDMIREGARRYILWQQISLPWLIRREKLDYFLAPMNTAPYFVPGGVKLLLVLHDLIPFEPFPVKNVVLALRLRLWRLLISKAVANAHCVLTISQYSRNEILARFPGAPVQVIPCTIPSHWFVEDSELVSVEGRAGYVLLVTSTEPHRNVERFFRAYARYALPLGVHALRLRIAGVSGKTDFVRSLAEHCFIYDFVTIEPRLSESALQNLMRNADVFCMPSLAEGFGIPILEAMSSGTPVLCSNVTSMPEVGGNAPEYFDPCDEGSITDALIRVSSSPERRAGMISAGRARAQLYHPSVVAPLIERFWTSLESER